MKKGNRLFRIGLISSIVSALCCFTPILVIVFSALGLSTAVVLIDSVVLPVFAGSVLLTLYAFFKKKRLNRN